MRYYHSMARIVAIDDEQPILDTFVRVLSTFGAHELQTFTSADEALPTIEKDSSVDLVLTDLRMEGMSGLKLLEVLSESRPDLPVIVISGYLSEDVVHRISELGCRSYLRKPFKIDDFMTAIRLALGEKQDG
jgi:DNA-binding NtrC family response regulator